MDLPPLANRHIHQRLSVLVLRIPHSLVHIPLSPILAIRRHPTRAIHPRPTRATHQHPILATHRHQIQVILPHPTPPLTLTQAILARIQDILDKTNLLPIPQWVEWSRLEAIPHKPIPPRIPLVLEVRLWVAMEMEEVVYHLARVVRRATRCPVDRALHIQQQGHILLQCTLEEEVIPRDPNRSSNNINSTITMHPRQSQR